MFDQVADTYDETFTNTAVGMLLRKVVWGYLDSVIKNDSALRILELNCGTGEDAIEFAKRGHHIIATDISQEMITVTNNKILNAEPGNIKALKCDMRDINRCNFEMKFDLVFSNFGGLNCLNWEELKTLSNNLSLLLNPTGRFISVIMPKFCLWETIYFALKLEWNKCFRRNTDQSLSVKVGAESVNTWYYLPNEINEIFMGRFNKVEYHPVGISLPPSYMDDYFKQKKNFLSRLGRWEERLNGISGLSFLADHFLMDMKLK